MNQILLFRGKGGNLFAQVNGRTIDVPFHEDTFILPFAKDQIIIDNRTGENLYYVYWDNAETVFKLTLQSQQTFVSGGGSRGLSQSTVISLINQFGSSGAAQLVSFRVPLTATQIQNANSSPIDIPELPAPGIGFAWEFVSGSVNFTANTTPFTSTSLQIITETAASRQANTTGALLNSGDDNFTRFVIQSLTSPQVVENKKMQINTLSDSAVGDGTAIVYGVARKITL